jgi:hypothetical protein
MNELVGPNNTSGFCGLSLSGLTGTYWFRYKIRQSCVICS